MCLVEVGERKPDGQIAMQPRLVPACQTLAKPQLVVKTDSEKVKKWQEQALEYLLLNHPLDCSICDQAGECYLQDYTYKYGRSHSRLAVPKVQREDKYHIGDQIALFTDRCVMCTRCVRFTREYSGTAELQVISRGSVEEIDVYDGQPCNNKLAGNVVDLCPVGALCSKDFLYQKRVWWLKHQESVCPRCSTGCSITVDQNENQVYRLRPRENPQAQGRFMCDEGRFGFKYIHAENRLLAPALGQSSAALSASTDPGTGLQRGGNGAAPETHEIYVDRWPQVLEQVRQKIGGYYGNSARSFVAVFSPFMTCEEAFLLARYLKAQHRDMRLVLGPVPVVGEDDRYPKRADGSSPDAEHTRFTIRAEKCPNRRGVSLVLEHFEGQITTLEQVIREGASTSGAYVVGGYPDPWITSEIEQWATKLELLIVQDFVQSPLTAKAHVTLAGGTFAERDGSFVNHAGLAQEIHATIRCPGDARPDGRILQELTGQTGLFNAARTRREMAAAIPAFASLAVGI